MEATTVQSRIEQAPDVLSGAGVEDLYLEHHRLLLYIGCRKFGVPESDAEGLIQEVFLSYLLSRGQVRQVRTWLVAAMCNASRYYQRCQRRTEPLPDDYRTKVDPRSDSLAERFALEMTIQKVLGYLQPKCRETLRMHYFEGRTASDVALQLDTTSRYAEKLIHKCLQRAREIFERIAAVQR